MPEREPGPESTTKPEPGGDEGPGRVQPRLNVVAGGKAGFRKRYESVGYWALLAIVLALVSWFLVSSAGNSSKARDAEATAIATLFAPETETAEAEESAESVE